MTLTEADIKHIQASWGPARKDTTGAGILLFKGLFTKFPDYLKFFNQFFDLDLERMHENKRLVNHAVKVIDTITFVVDSIGDPKKADRLDEALKNLVRSHLKRRIGHKEFYNLGLVIIDFICDLNNRRSLDCSVELKASHSRPISGGDYPNNTHGNPSANSSQDSETMTIALDKIRASASPSSSSDDDNILARSLGVGHLKSNNESMGELREGSQIDQILTSRIQILSNCSDDDDIGVQSPKLDMNGTVKAWRELYSVILNLVKREETQAQTDNR